MCILLFLGPGPCTDLADVQLVIEFILLSTEQIITCNNPILKYICICKIRISLKNMHMTMGIAEHRPNEADAAGIGIPASGISSCVMRDFILPLWVNCHCTLSPLMHSLSSLLHQWKQVILYTQPIAASLLPRL